MAIEGVDIVKAAAFIGAGISMGLGAIGPGVGEGMVQDVTAGGDHRAGFPGVITDRHDDVDRVNIQIIDSF